MTRRLDFNIFSLGATALAITVLISLFAGISSNNSPSSSDSPYSLNLEKSPSGSYLNLLVAESEADASLKINTDYYNSPTSSPIAPSEPESSSSTPKPSATIQPSTPTPSPTPETPAPDIPVESPDSDHPTETSEPDAADNSDESTTDLAALITEFKTYHEKISALLDQLNNSLDHLYPEKIIYQPELDALYPALSELDQLLTLESDFVSAHSAELPDFYRQRHESNLSAFSTLRDRLNHLLENLKPLSEDIDTYSYASFCKSLVSNSPTPSPNSNSSELPDNSASDPSDDPTSDLSTDSTSADSSDPLDSFGFPICSAASYAAEKAFDFYSLSLADWGDPSSWRDSALALGFTVDDSPSAHSIGLDLSDELSPHIIWVESLTSSPTSTPSASPTPTVTTSPTATPSISPDSTPDPSPTFSTSAPDPSPTSPSPTPTSTSSALINLSEYNNILTPKTFSYRTSVPASSYLFIHLDSPSNSD